MKQVQVDIVEIKVTDDPEATLITYALGSCIAVMVHDPVRQVGGMIHYMLPLSKISPEKAAAKPGMFADTGIPLLFNRMYELGCQKKDLVIKVAGGSKLNDNNSTFDIGKRNYVILRKLFWKNDLLIAAEDVGGEKTRTALLNVNTGQVIIRSGGEEVEL